MDTKSEEKTAIESLTPVEMREHVTTGNAGAWNGGPHALFLAGVVLRGLLALLVVCCALYVFSLLHTWSAAILAVGLASAGLAWILLDDAFDIEAAVSHEAARAAVFEPDQFGTRAAAVYAYSDEFVRQHGRAPWGAPTLKQPGTNRSFRAQFTATHTYRSWYMQALLLCLQRGLRVVAAGLLTVIAAQVYVVLAG